MDENALNYSSEAKKDDSSCVNAMKATITSYSWEYPSTNAFGNPWDPSDDPDTKLSITFGSNGIEIFGSVVNNNPIGIASMNVSSIPSVEPLDQTITLKLWEVDGLVSYGMSSEILNLNEYTTTGDYKTNYPAQITITSSNYTLNLGLEWE